MTDIVVAAVGGKQPSGQFRPGIVEPPFAEHDMAHYVIDAIAAGVARAGGSPYVEYDPEMEDEGAAASVSKRDPRCADMVAFDGGREAGVVMEIAPGTSTENRESAERAVQLVAKACDVRPLGVRESTRAFLTETSMPAWWVSLACLDADADRDALHGAHFLSRAGEALAQARCEFLGLDYRPPDRGAAPSKSADRVDRVARTGWFKENHPVLELGAGCDGEPSDPTAHLQTMLGVLVDGRFGYTTQMALQAAQRRFGLEENGVCRAATWGVLHSIERQGSVGYTAKEIQRELGIADDGVFGPVTAAHVEAFQREVDTIADGRVTEQHYRLMLG
jgi:peptidoglycan hydrolase-like protein with peptidoglycan-binding domain